MKKILLFIVRRVLSLRYKVDIIWTEHLYHKWPILLLPNHVALIEPRILLSFLGKYIPISPVASEMYYNKPGINQVMRFFDTVPIGDMSAGASAEDVEKVFEKLVQALKSWKNILIYPSWQIYRQWFESIKWKQSVHHVVQHMPKDTKVIGIKTRGIWGSIWSKAWDNGKTTFGKAYLQSIWYVFANFLLFVPKRKVSITLEDISWEVEKNKNKSLNEFNSFLEQFFNTEDSKSYKEPIDYIQHYFYYNDTKHRSPPEIITGSEEDLQGSGDKDTSSIDESIKQDILNKVALIKELSVTDINDTSNLVLDLFFDSLDTAEIKSYIQSRFKESSNPPITDLKNIQDLYLMAVWLSHSEEQLKEVTWWIEKQTGSLGKSLVFSNTDTILSLWKKTFQSSPKDSFLWDNIFWSQTKKDITIKAYVVAQYLKKLPGERIGIMLPSVGSASIIILATYLAGKTPVMFNWTLGKESFDHCVKFSKVDHILTSRNFFEKVTTPFLQEYDDAKTFLYLEEMLKNVSVGKKISSFIKSLYLPIPKLSKTAVILFTSGSESLPKAVALTHTNIIANIQWTLEVVDIQTDDRLIGFLPPFHSFGFTANTIMPLITGLQIVYTPDPNDATTILEIIKHTGVTGITATPTFLKMILAVTKEHDLENIRYAVVGAEKCSEEVSLLFKKLAPNGVILEGYGITECSPVVSINPILGSKLWTVWKVIPNLDCILLDVDTHKPVSEWNQGMIYVKGNSIFWGYLDTNIETPFEEIEWESYYKTGDLGKVDSDGFLTITWRLKRFVKIAGEMISLPFVENILASKYWSSDTLKIAVEAAENDGNVKLVLFSTEDLEPWEVNDFLRSNGVSNLIKISEIVQISEIPVLGTGKTDYKTLKNKIIF